MRPVKSIAEVEFLYGKENPWGPAFTRIFDKWLADNSHYKNLFANTNPHHLENLRAFTFTAEKYVVPSLAAMGFAFEEAIANKRLVNSDGTHAAIFVAPEPPIEAPDRAFLEEIGQMSPSEVAHRFKEDPNSRWVRRYRLASQSYGYRIPYGFEQDLGAPAQDETDSWATLTSQQWHSIPAREASRLMMTDKNFKKNVYRLIAENAI